MGQRVSDEIVVSAPPEVVRAVADDVASYPEWAEGVQEVEVLERDAQGRPTKARFVVDARIMTVRYTLAFTHTEHGASWNLLEGAELSQFDGEYRLAPDGDGTRVRYNLEVDVTLPAPSFVKQRAAKQILEAALHSLKRRAESRA